MRRFAFALAALDSGLRRNDGVGFGSGSGPDRHGGTSLLECNPVEFVVPAKAGTSAACGAATHVTSAFRPRRNDGVWRFGSGSRFQPRCLDVAAKSTTASNFVLPAKPALSHQQKNPPRRRRASLTVRPPGR